MRFLHIDVFSCTPFHGKRLNAVFAPSTCNDENDLQKITAEFNTGKTVFIYPAEGDYFRARIFTESGEQKFAGHPVMGASAAVHYAEKNDVKTMEIIFRVGERQLKTLSEKKGGCFRVKMSQGYPEYIKTIKERYYDDLYRSLGIGRETINDKFKPEIISTGTPTLILPVTGKIDLTDISSGSIFPFLDHYKTKQVSVLDINTLECRIWVSGEYQEVPASGSAAGPVCAYLVKNGIRDAGDEINLLQGLVLKRKSLVSCVYDRISNEISISGDVTVFSEGNIVGRTGRAGSEKRV